MLDEGFFLVHSQSGDQLSICFSLCFLVCLITIKTFRAKLLKQLYSVTQTEYIDISVATHSFSSELEYSVMF